VRVVQAQAQLPVKAANLGSIFITTSAWGIVQVDIQLMHKAFANFVSKSRHRFENCFIEASCSTGCMDCSSPTVCITCESGYYLFNDACDTDCPTGMTKNTGNNECEGKCDLSYLL